MIVFSPADAIPWSTSVKTRSDSAHWCPHFSGTPHLKIRGVTIIYPVTWSGVVRPATAGHGINAANSSFAWDRSCTCIHQHVPSCLQSGTGESVVCGCNNYSNNGNVKGGVWPGLLTDKSGDYPGFGNYEWLGVFLNPPGWDPSPSQGYPLKLNLPLSICTSDWKEVQSVLWRCLAQEHNAVTLARALTKSTRSGVGCVNNIRS